MSLNGITNVYASYQASYTKSTEVKSEKEATTTTGNVAEGATYESTINKETDRTKIVAALKADAEARVNSFKQMVQDMLFKQGKKVSSTEDMWRMLASGDFTVDAETAAKAKEEISEDGYWGVNQTSQRIFDMAVALSGGDEDKMDEMLEAFKKGFKQATKTWGRELPDISQKTYDAVMDKFENYNKEDVEK
ncbi:MAG: hypothetical protein J6L69_04185 [Lachnospiraceae bacterium]|nr:hypothetical protein [Lachnospiraceae bacterium]